MALDRTTKGVLLGCASFAVFSLSDACVKSIKGGLPPYESAFFGAVFGLTILPFLLRKGDHWIDILSTTNLPLWLVRFLAYPMGLIGSVTAFTHLSMAEAFVLIFFAAGLHHDYVSLFPEGTGWLPALERRGDWFLGSADCVEAWVSSAFYRTSRSSVCRSWRSCFRSGLPSC
jgi:hypothetical protein